MTFEETLVHVRAMLEREGRVAYRMLKRRFVLDDDDVEDLKADLIEAKHLAVDEAGKVLVWAGGKAKEELGDQGTEETGERAEEHPPPQALDSARGARGDFCQGLCQSHVVRVITSGKAGGLEIVNRSKRLLLISCEPPKVARTVKPGATQGGYFLNSASCSKRLSSLSWC